MEGPITTPASKSTVRAALAVAADLIVRTLTSAKFYVGATAVLSLTALGVAVVGTLSTTGNATVGQILDARPAVTTDGAPAVALDGVPAGCTVDGGATCWDAGAPVVLVDAGPEIVLIDAGSPEYVGGLTVRNGIVVNTGDITATLGDVSSGDDLLCGDDLAFQGASPAITTSGTTDLSIAPGGGDTTVTGTLTATGVVTANTDGLTNTASAVPGLTISNTTASTAGATTHVPGYILLSGTAYDNDGAGLGSHTEKWRIRVDPETGTSVRSFIYFERQQDSGSWTTALTMSSAGIFYANSISATGTAAGITLTGNRAASTATADVTITSSVDRDAGKPLLSVRDTSGGSDVFTVSSEGNCTCGGDLTVSGGDINPDATTTTINGGSGSTGATFTNGDLALAGTVTAAGGSTTHAVCWKGSVLSYCESVVAADGTCTCH